MNNYEKLQKVGEGTYGQVYKATDKTTGRIVALKKTRLQKDDEGIPPTALREVSLLQMLSEDRHIVSLLDVEYSENKEGRPVLYLVFEYIESDLKKYMDTFRNLQRRLPTPIVKRFMYQLCEGIAYCHGHGVMHRDLKPSNLLVDEKEGMLKIADLGLGRAFTVPVKKYTHEVVTLWYRAPEVLLGDTHYSTPVDIWLLGTPNEEVWPGVSKLNDWHDYPQWKPRNLAAALPVMEPSAIDLLSKMLNYEPSKRISAKKAMDHPYFDDLDRSQI